MANFNQGDVDENPYLILGKMSKQEETSNGCDVDENRHFGEGTH